ncbi:MAG: hypothetical protein ACUVSV_04235 [Armatimonadota bacterium]
MRIVWIGALATLWASVTGQPISPHLQDAVQQRESRLRGVRLVWQMDFTRLHRVSSLGQAGQQMESALYETYLRELRERGVPSAEAESQARQLAGQVAASIPLQPLRFRAKYIVDLIGDRIHVRGSAPAGSPSGWERMTWDILYDGETAIAVPVEWTFGGQVFSARAGESAGRGIAPPWVRVWKGSGRSADHRFSRTPLPMTPEIICLLSGLSPLGMYQGVWQSKREDAGEWILLQQVTKGEMAPFVVQLHLSKRYGGAVSRIEWRHERTNTYEHYTVSKWMQYKDIWLPSRITDERATPIGVDKREWTLKQVGEATEHPIEIARGYPVADYRLQTSMPPVERTGGQEDLRVAYTWTGSLPTETELKRIKSDHLASRQERAMGAGRYARLIPPLLLILIGTLWYWRLKVKKVA